MRRYFLNSFITALLLAPAASPAFEASPDGVWKGKLSTRDGEIEQVLNLRTSGANLSGTVTSPEGTQIEIKNGHAADNHVSFTINLDYHGQPLVLTYSGTVSQNEMNLEIRVDGSDEPRTLHEVVHRLNVCTEICF
jgi:hypothetical protein